jgi:hypothetical protein
METKNREKLLLMLTGACVALWLLNLLVLSPMIDSWHSRSAEIDKLKTDIADGAGLIRRKSTIQGRWDFMRANALNSNPTVAERQLFSAFDRWVKSGGVAQGSFRPQFQESDTNYTTVDCHSDVNGSPDNVRDFVRAMSKDPLANKLDSFVLTAKDDNGQQLALDLNMSGLVLTDSVPLLPSGLADATPPPRDTLSSTNTESDPFQLIRRNNIFDQSRRFSGDNGPRILTSRPPPMEEFGYSGPAIDYGKGGTPSATFTGSGASSSHMYNRLNTINEFTITKITLDSVTLTNASNTFVVMVDKGLRREGNGPWRPAGDIASTPTPDTISTTSASSSSSSGANMDAVLARLKKQREEAK